VRKTLVLVAALVVATVLPTAASAAVWRGVVVAEDGARHTLATASTGGVVRTVRTAALARVAVGDRVAIRARRLADGTYRASRVTRAGRATRATLRATVVARQARLGRTVVSAGGSVFAIASRASRAPAALAAGDVIAARVAVSTRGLRALGVREVGRTDVIKLEGIFLDFEGSVLRLAVVKKGLVVVQIPDEMEVPDLEAGDVIQLVVSLDDEGRFVLVSVRGDDERGDDEKGVDVGDDEVTVRGTISALSSSSVSVRPGSGASAVACSLPAGAPLDGFFAGDEVELHCHFAEGAFHLEYLKGKHGWLKVRDEGMEAELTRRGVISELGPPSVGVVVRGRLIRCARPAEADLSAFAVGSEAELHCHFDEGAFRLARLKTNSAVWEHEDPEDEPELELALEGVLTGVTEDAVVVQAGAHAVTCARGEADLRGFFAGEKVYMRCRSGGGLPELTKLMSPWATWRIDGDAVEAELTVKGQLMALDAATVTVRKLDRNVACGHANANLSAFAPGQQVEMHCRLRNGQFRIEYLKNEHTKVVLGP
jgi:hypothetical protein